MFTITNASAAAHNVTEHTLRLAPARCLAFLQGVAHPPIHAKLVPVGWSVQQRDNAWKLLNELNTKNPMPVIAPSDPVAGAIVGCEDWQGTALVRARTVMPLSHPAQAAFLFHDFEQRKGMGAVLNDATFLERCHILEKGTGRKETHKADLEALLVLEEIGVTKADRKRVQEMIDIVQAEPEAVIPDLTPEQQAASLDVLRRIYTWVTAWSDLARTVVTRRDQQIRLGIAKRRPMKAKAVAPPAAAIPPPTSPAPAPAASADDENGPESRAA